MLVSILVATNRPLWRSWLDYQLNKVCTGLDRAGFKYEIIIDDCPFEETYKKRNNLIDKAKGQVCAFMDDDDFSSENRIVEQIGSLRNADVVVCSPVLVYSIHDKCFYETRKISEGNMCFTRDYGRNHRFGSDTGPKTEVRGRGFVANNRINSIRNSREHLIMIHHGKNGFLRPEGAKVEGYEFLDDQEIRLLGEILIFSSIK